MDLARLETPLPSPPPTGPESKRSLGNPEGLHLVMGDETFIFRGFSYSTRGTPLSYPGLMPQLLENFAQTVNGVRSGTLTIGGIDIASWMTRSSNITIPNVGHSIGGAVASVSATFLRATEFAPAAGQIQFNVYTYARAPKNFGVQRKVS
jgi:hypothetical protein